MRSAVARRRKSTDTRRTPPGALLFFLGRQAVKWTTSRVFHKTGWGERVTRRELVIWRQWPVSGLWVLGLFIGIDMIFYGWSLIMLALAVRGLPQPQP